MGADFLTADEPAFADASSFAKATKDKTAWQVLMGTDWFGSDLFSHKGCMVTGLTNLDHLQ